MVFPGHAEVRYGLMVDSLLNRNGDDGSSVLLKAVIGAVPDFAARSLMNSGTFWLPYSLADEGTAPVVDGFCATNDPRAWLMEGLTDVQREHIGVIIKRELLNSVHGWTFMARWTSYFHAMLKQQGIRYAYFYAVPHTGLPYAAYLACLRLGVDFRILRHTSVPGVCYLSAAVDHPLQANGDRAVMLPLVRSRLSAAIDLVLNAEAEVPHEYMLRQRSTYVNAWSWLPKAVISRLKKIAGIAHRYGEPTALSSAPSPARFAHTQSVLAPGRLRPGRRAHWVVNASHQIARSVAFSWLHLALCAATRLRRHMGGPYVVVFLHYQPERTTVPEGGFWHRQERVIKLLDEGLPKRLNIIVREHSTQHHPGFAGFLGRSPTWYFEVLLRSTRTTVTAWDRSAVRVANEALGVVTVTGTVGWEQWLRRKPVLASEGAWYSALPGVNVLESESGLSSFLNIADQNAPSEYALPNRESIIQFLEVYFANALPVYLHQNANEEGEAWRESEILLAELRRWLYSERDESRAVPAAPVK